LHNAISQDSFSLFNVMDPNNVKFVKYLIQFYMVLMEINTYDGTRNAHSLWSDILTCSDVNELHPI